MPYRSTEILSPGPTDKAPLHRVTLTHDQRHLRRKLLHLENDDVVMLDLKEPVMLADGDLLVLEGGGYIEVKAAEEALYEIRPRDRLHLIELAWHLGNRHLPAAIEEGRILIARDPVIRAMLEGLGATVSDVVEPFHPLRGAYHGTGGHHHGHGHDHHHG
ncbi:urease accessory protein UreE [Sinorhizobium fredii USDA 205]|uniref:Urease accessory protein UreE n=1 Tax=Rhizobium fredii TaxID=380 RepID=A0A2A6M2K8_RHIFR|nr:urease accessory protein UreE [Sinorhizobium fredii]ASY70009.1 Urease accessory protein UreE [Sinorhizobium fredii CCBAU 83666]AWM26055.1 Urease accessory protein UreE [Sinorhizobium fredii CCBAU 25509]KSV91813.1 urease accessory protein UreE [Sinorhizobium fredii USDA 205]MCG5475720.1 urease accessory protein UreE [Sinorhizobium fredii]MQW94555.1 urease accessory protein UreE [Sinorhizobium fredii]